MDRRRYTGVVWGILLILVGIVFLLSRFFPSVVSSLSLEFTWPFIVIAAGFIMLILAGGLRSPELAIPACIVGGIGVILWWQNYTDNWGSWAYIWTLIPGFAGVGTIIASLLGGKGSISEGVRTVIVSLVLFGIFASFFGAFGLAGKWWPLLLIVLGLLLLAQGFFRFGRKPKQEGQQ
jgi:hypothetical protein